MSKTARHSAGDFFTQHRLYLASGLVFLFAAGIISRLVYLQIVDYNQYETLANKQHQQTEELFPDRGQIFMQDGWLGAVASLATNRRYYLVYAQPSQIINPTTTAEALAPLLEVSSTADLLPRLNKPNSEYQPLKHKVSEEVKDQLVALNLKGINFEEEYWRFYPENNLASHVLGFVGFNPGDDIPKGQYGLEGYWNKELSGAKGYFTFERDVSGRLIPIARRALADKKNGSDLVLTLERSVQFTACQTLQEEIAKHGANGGSLIIMEPYTGEIWAMCSFPDFNPNNYNQVKNINTFNDQVVFDPYEPGSVFKPITMAMGIDLGKVRPETTFNDTGQFKAGGFTIRNSDKKANGIQTMIQVLDKSLNTGAIFVAQKVGVDNFKQYLRNFGFFNKTNLPVAGERVGNLTSLNNKGDIFLATASFGQGITVTPIQLVTAYAALANGGKLVKPLLVKELKNPDGTIQKFEPQFIRQVVSPQTAYTLAGMLASVVGAAIPGYHVAGKTGTAQVYNAATKDYDESNTSHTFIGFTPVSKPRFVMLIKMDDPKDVQFAEGSVVPVFAKVGQFLLNYLQVPPERPMANP
ncbi:MAG: penicillin-binding protein 2 [Candidatus Komeilibacteria bacterium]|nr:penicillin-binding protein 2 [Candidatus Komeilibacteria bacterium]